MPRKAKPPAPSSAVESIGYVNPDHPRVGIEAFTLDELRKRVAAEHLARPQRLDFHQLIFCQAGQGLHAIDFRNYQWNPGTLFHVRPGQVQQFVLQPGMEAQCVLFTAAFLSMETGDLLHRYANLGDECRFQLDFTNPGHQRIADGFDAIAAEYRCIDSSLLAARLLHHLLHALLLRILGLSEDSNAVVAPDAMHQVYHRFLADLEQRYRSSRQVEDYAAALGYSAKTLGRACIGVAGASPKKLIEQRVALEAKRLLVHSASSVKRISHELGFSEETNFVKFFRRVAAMPPSAFRQQHRL